MADLPDRLLRDREVEEITGLSRTTRWRWEKAGKFPQRRQIGPNSVGWLESEILQWLDSLSMPNGQRGAR